MRVYDYDPTSSNDVVFTSGPSVPLEGLRTGEAVFASADGTSRVTVRFEQP